MPNVLLATSRIFEGVCRKTALTPDLIGTFRLAQWLPKPASRWMPRMKRPLRGLWSPMERDGSQSHLD
jgi:hypothetical protein